MVIPAIAVVVVAVVAVTALVRAGSAVDPRPDLRSCVATAGDTSVSLSLEQGRYAAIIAGLSIRRGLAPRAASIALATAYQESGIRNLEYGDRDSLGLFQQRPSQGWGTPTQLQNPYYATGKFYDALIRVRGWESADITEVAQRVQRSGHPEAYRDHEADARVLASVLTGRSPAGLTCLDDRESAGEPAALLKAVRKTFGKTSATRRAGSLTLDPGSPDEAWAMAHFVVTHAAQYGVAGVGVGNREWRSDPQDLPRWTAADTRIGRGQVAVTLR